MMSNLILLSLIGSILFQVPDPLPPIDPEISVPAGALPWSMPQLPVVDIDLGLGTPSFDEVDHGDNYSTNLAEINDRLGTSGDIEDDLETEADDWIGPAAVIPDMSIDDFDTGIDLPGYEDMTAYDVSAALGSNVGTLFAQVRSLTTIDVGLSSSVLAIGFLILCIAWMVLVQMIVFGVQFIDMAWSVLTTLIELIPVAE